jgi:predicted permease
MRVRFRPWGDPMRAFLARLRDAFRREAIDREFEEERQFHLRELEELHMQGGASPEAARAAAARDFGNVTRSREDLRSQAGFPGWDELANDFRHALRGITRRPWLMCSVVAILAFGLAAAATIHGLIDTVFLRPLPVSHPGELRAVVSADPSVPNRLSRPTVRRLEASLPANSVAAYSGEERCTAQVGSQDAYRAVSQLVNGSFFATLGVAPAAGRTIGESDDVVGSPANVLVGSYAWAKKNFGSPEAALGREVFVNRKPLAVVGVMPESFHGVSLGRVTDFWFAMALQPGIRIYSSSSSSTGDDRPNDPDWNREERISWLQMLVRVRPGAADPLPALQRAWQPELDDLILTHDDPAERGRLMHYAWGLVPAPGGLSRFRDHFRSTGILLSWVVAVMLVLVCTNVSGLLLVRTMSRHREIGVRLAIGGGSFQIARLAFFEALILNIAGGAAGWIMAGWLLPLAAQLLAPGQDLNVNLGARSMVFMMGIVLVSAILSALIPALWISRVQPLNALSGNRGLGRAPLRLGRLFVVTQFAIAVFLVALATALGSELQRSLNADPGFTRDGVVTAVFDAASAGYDDKAILPLMDRMKTTLSAVAGVRGVAFASSGILAGRQSSSEVFARDPGARIHQSNFQHDSVSLGYFGVVGIPLIIGRDFSETDGANSRRVTVVSASFARQVFGEKNPIGEVVGFDDKPSKEDMTVVGVAADVRMNGVREEAPPVFYMPLSQWADGSSDFMAVEFEGPEPAVQESLRAALARTEPGLVLANWMTLRNRISDDLSRDIATSRLASVFGGCALLLAGIGIAGSLGYLVVLRQRELALRMAIGAPPSQVLRCVLMDSLRLSAVGTALGVIAAWLVPMLPAVGAELHSRPGIGTALVAAVVASATAVIAGSIPARRAARIDPILILKSE